jgi:hypothetical protein
MRLRNLLLIFAVGILLGAAAVSLFGGGRTAPSPDAPKDPEPIALSPAPTARPPRAARLDPPPPAPPKPDPPKATKTKPPENPYPVRPAKPFIQEAQVSHSFDGERLERLGCFASDDIAWMRLRWDEFEEERQVLVDRATRGEQKWDGAEWVGLQRTLRETLGDTNYNGLLYATGQPNGVHVSTLPSASRAAKAGLRRGDRVLGYNGVQVYERRELQLLALDEYFERLVEIKVRHADDTIEALWIEPGSLGVHLVIETISPCLDQDRDPL